MICSFHFIKDGTTGGYCSASVICHDANAVCSGNICHCDTGYRNIDDVCRKGELSDTSIS